MTVGPGSTIVWNTDKIAHTGFKLCAKEPIDNSDSSIDTFHRDAGAPISLQYDAGRQVLYAASDLFVEEWLVSSIPAHDTYNVFASISAGSVSTMASDPVKGRLFVGHSDGSIKIALR